MKTLYLALSFFIIAFLSACGTDTSSGNRSTAADPIVMNDVSFTVINDPDSANPQPGDAVIQQPARISLNITDAPLVGVVKVVVTFSSIEFIRDNPSQSLMYSFNTPKQIDLLTLQGSISETLLKDIEIEAGDYNEVRVRVDDSNMNSYVELDDGSVYELKIPSGSTSGVKIKGDIHLEEMRTNTYTVDFDLRKSLVKAGASGKYELKPVVRIVENKYTGHISGSVDSALLTSADCSDADPDTYNLVYVYEGFDVDPSDININSTEKNQPVTTSIVHYDTLSGDYIYEAAYLPQGEYTIAFTCNADLENPDTYDELRFFNVQNITVQINNILFL